MRFSRFALFAAAIIMYYCCVDITLAQTTGLHVTQEELTIWKQRALSGPYKNVNDVSINSPGDWTRIQSNADIFVSNPSIERWKGQTLESCLVFNNTSANPGRRRGDKLRDAAFAYLITENAKYRNAVKAELLAQSAEPGTDFSNRTKWCTTITGDASPSFEIANWLTKLIFAYSYIRSTLSTEERTKLDSWFLNAGRYWENPTLRNLENAFPTRRMDDYSTVGARGAPTCTFGKCVTHYNGWKRYNNHENWNNRAATHVRFYGLVGILLNDSHLKSQAKRFFKEWLRFAVFPDGTQAEFSRWQDVRPSQGWHYTGLMLGSMITLADHFARHGDPDLYNYTTSEGLTPITPPGGPKSLKEVIKLWMKHVNRMIIRYGTDQVSRYGNPDYLIDAEDEVAKEKRVHDVIPSQANIYFKDELITAIYTRTAANTPPYPPNPANGGYEPWSGEWGIYPGVLFMFGKMEGRVWPYSSIASSASSVSKLPASPLLNGVTH